MAAPNGFGQFFALHFIEQGFVVEQLELGRTTALKEVDDTLGFGREVWFGQDTFDALVVVIKAGAHRYIGIDERAQRSSTKAHCSTRQKFPAR